MGVIVPQVISEDRASGAQIVDGGLRFDSGKSHNLINNNTRSASSANYTVSVWIKRVSLNSSGLNAILQYETGATFAFSLTFYDDKVYAYDGTGLDANAALSDGVLRDTSGWYHLLYKRISGGVGTLYINGVQQSKQTSNTLNVDAFAYNGSIGYRQSNSTRYLDAYVNNLYVIDGQALGPEYFGYTDQLTNVWRPKKLDITKTPGGSYGDKGFYLPFDGSAPIGQDQSGRGNNWTPVNFGGSNTLEKATGALPILNTDGGGKIARVGVRTDSYFANLKLAVPFVGVATDVVQQINGNSAAMSSFTANNATFAVHPTNGAPYGTGLYLNSVSDYPNINYASGTFNFLHNQTGSGTVEFWMYNGSFNTEAVMLTSISGSPDVGFAVQMASSTTLQAIISRGVSGSARSSGTANIPQNTWSHIAVTKTINGSNAELKLYVNGVLSASNTSITASDLSNSNSTYSYFRIGQNIGDETARGWTNYYMNDLRIYDTAKYTQNFIPASTDPDILPDTPSGVSYTSNLTQITDGAVAFDGSGDYLSLASSADFNIGSNAASLELFVYLNSTSSAQIFNGQNSGSNSTIRLGYWVDVGNIGFSYTVNDDTRRGKVLGVVGKWYHLLVTITGGTGRFFIDGVLQSYDTGLGSVQSLNETYYIGTEGASEGPLNGFISNFHLVNGSIPTQYQTSVTTIGTQVFTPPSAPISSVANTKLLCCKSNSSATAFDVSPGSITANGDAAATNFNPFTANINTQRGKQSGYATLNPLAVVGGASYSNGNLKVTGSTAYRSTPSTIEMRVGKWYVEYFFDTWVNDSHVGVMNNISPSITGTWAGNTSNGFAWAGDSGDLWTGGGLYNSSFDVSFTTGDTCQIAFDADNGNMYFGKNGIWLKGANPSAGTGANWTGLTNGPYYPFVTTTNGTICSANFGQKPFKFPPPAGFQPLTLANTPRPTIVRPDQFVGVTTYIGNGGTSTAGTLARTLTGLTFKPDLIWVKERTATGTWADHNLTDSVRGTGLALRSNTTDTETNIATAFSQGGIGNGVNNGFTIISGTGGGTNNVNANNSNYVAWAWKAGGNSNTYNINDVGYATASAAGLTAGTITPTGASVNTKSGFSIIKVPGTASAASFSHGLGQAPSFVILKETNGTGDWQVGHKSLSSGAWTSRLGLNLTTAEETTSSAWNNTPPTSSLITVGATSNVNNDFIVYAWAEIPGFSKFGSYTGNGNADGPVIITGFRPRFLLFKSAGVGDWVIIDTTRDTYNVSGYNLYPNDPVAESFNARLDILSNGFKLRSTFTSTNPSGTSVVYAAFAETPTQNLYGAQANAR